MADKKPKAERRKTGPKPKPRVSLTITMPPDGVDHVDWVRELISDFAEQEPIADCARLTIRAGESFDLMSVSHATIDLLQAAGILEHKARITDLDARIDRTVPREAVEVEARGTYDPSNRTSGDGRRAIIEGRMRMWSMLRNARAAYERNGVRHA